MEAIVAIFELFMLLVGLIVRGIAFVFALTWILIWPRRREGESYWQAVRRRATEILPATLT